MCCMSCGAVLQSNKKQNSNHITESSPHLEVHNSTPYIINLQLNIVELLNLFFCQKCSQKINIIQQQTCCKKCGYPLSNDTMHSIYGAFLDTNDKQCPSCHAAGNKHFFCIARSCYGYHGTIKRLIINYKFHFQTETIDFIGLSLFYVYQQMPKADIICFIPITKTKLFLKGYNHAGLIANNFYQHTRQTNQTLILLPDLLLKNRVSEASKHLTQNERWRKKQNFIINNKYLAQQWQDMMRNKTILVIDDIMTTGATLNEAAKVIKTAFNHTKVECLTFARTLLY